MQGIQECVHIWPKFQGQKETAKLKKAKLINLILLPFIL
jgi:hypothetical protein